MAVVFDTHTWIKRLKEAGFTEEQAEAEVGLVVEALAANIKDLATKDDLRHELAETKADLRQEIVKLDTKIERLAAEMGILKWLAGLIGVGILMLILKAFLGG